MTLPTHFSCTYWSTLFYGRACGYSQLGYEANAAVYLLGAEFPLQIYYDFGIPAIMIVVFYALVFSGMWFVASGTASSIQNTTREEDK